MRGSFAYLMPLAGALTGLAVVLLIQTTRNRRAYDWPLTCFHAALAIWNVLIVLLFSASSERSARGLLFAIHHVIPLFQAAFLWCALRLSGRQERWPVVAVTAGAFCVTALAHYSFWLVPGDTFFVRGVERHVWGWYPRLGFGAEVYQYYSAVLAIAAFSVLFLAGSPGGAAARVRWLFLAFWAALATNYLPVNGVDILPVGNAADAVISTAIALRLYGPAVVSDRGRRIRSIAASIGSLSFAVLATYLFFEFTLPTEWISPAIASVLGGFSALAAYHLLILPRALPESDAPRGDRGDGLIGQLQQDFGLTEAEIGICVELRRGIPRGRIPERLRISAGTLKGHLNSIYRKTIDLDRNAPTGRDKLQRLTVFLERLEELARR